MGVLGWFSQKTDSEDKSSQELVRYLCTMGKEYESMDDFLTDFFEVINETITRYNQSSLVQAEKLDRDEAQKVGGNWVFKANITKLDEQGEKIENSQRDFTKRKSTLKVIARKQPHFAIELSGTEGLISPFLENLENVLKEKELDYNVDIVAKPGLGKATQPET